MSGKLVQILSQNSYLYALDESGEVWWLDGPDKGNDRDWDWKSVLDDYKRPTTKREDVKVDQPRSN